MILKKLGDEYKLYSHDSCIATTYESPYKKLSLKNCQAIANGYEFDELAREACDITDPYFKIGFNKGFQKALEILGDKKFSETELYRAFLINSAGNNTTLENTFKEIVLPMFQQTEWDVEVEMENSLTNGYKNQPDNVIGFIAEYKSVPKLDADGCLILKRK
jgi:hypothetical protein